MDIFNLLHEDHVKVKDLLNKIDKSSDNRLGLFNQVKEEILIHSKAEERTFYARLMEDAETEEDTKHAKKEHQKIENLLNEISDIDEQGKGWDEKFSELKEAVEHHIKEEESEIFEQAKAILGNKEKETLAEEMSKEKKKEKFSYSEKKRAA